MNALSFLQNCENTKAASLLILVFPRWLGAHLLTREWDADPEPLHVILTRHNVRSCLCMPFPSSPSLLHYWWSARVQHRCFSLLRILYFSRSVGEHMFPCEPVPSFSQHLLVLHKQSSSAPQIWAQETLTDVDFLFSLLASGEHDLQIMSPFLLCSKWLGMQIFLLLSTQLPSVTPACFCPLSSKSFFVLALQMGSRMSFSSVYSPYNCLVCEERMRQTSHTKYFHAHLIYFSDLFLWFFHILLVIYT